MDLSKALIQTSVTVQIYICTLAFDIKFRFKVLEIKHSLDFCDDRVLNGCTICRTLELLNVEKSSSDTSKGTHSNLLPCQSHFSYILK